MNRPTSYRLMFNPKRIAGYRFPLMSIGAALILIFTARFLSGGLLLFSTMLWLLERNEGEFYRMLFDRRPQLELRPSGIDVIQRRKPLFVKWENVVDLQIGIRSMDGGDKNVELYIYTRNQGNVCLPIEQLSIESIQAFKSKVDGWWNWVKKERIRIALNK